MADCSNYGHENGPKKSKDKRMKLKQIKFRIIMLQVATIQELYLGWYDKTTRKSMQNDATANE